MWSTKLSIFYLTQGSVIGVREHATNLPKLQNENQVVAVRVTPQNFFGCPGFEFRAADSCQ
jgi:hypothetical protein